MTVIYNKDPHRVMTVQHITPGNKRGMMQTKLRNLRAGTQSEARFRSDERVERATLEQHEMEYLYATGEDGDAVKYLLPNSRITIEFFEGRPVGIELPKTVDIKVTYTEPGVKGATATNTPKPATLETGLTLQVPTFIEIDDVVRVDTATGEYLSRA
jgi:elongation factor P